MRRIPQAAPLQRARLPFLAFLLIGLAVLPAPARGQVELHWWHAMSGANTDVIVGLADEFNASQEDYRVIPSYKGSYEDTLRAGLAAAELGSPPHILQVFEVGATTMLAERRFIRSASDIMREAGEPLDPRSYLPAVTGHYSGLDGEMLSMPFNTSSMVMWLNIDALKRAGLGREPLATWPDVFAAARRLRRAGHATCGFSNAWSTWAHLEQLSAWHNLPIATRANGLDGPDAVLVFNGPVQVRHLENLVELQRDRSYDYSGRGSVGESRFIREECPIFLASSAFYGALLAQARFAWKAAPMPIYPDVPGAPQNSIIGGGSLWAMAGKTEPEYRGVARFFSFLSEPERQLRLFERLGYIPSSLAAVRMMRDPGLDEAKRSLAVAMGELTNKEPTENSRGIRLGDMTRLRDIWSEEIEAALARQKPAKAALDDAVARGNEVLRRFEARVARQ